MECYICHNLIKRHEYARHVGSHLAGNDVGTHPQLNPTLPTFSYDTVDYDHYGTVFPPHSTPLGSRACTPLEYDPPLRPVTPTPYDQSQWDSLEDFPPQIASPDNHRRAHFTPSHSSARTTGAPARVHRRETSTGQSAQPNAFQLWHMNLTHDFPAYTTIDGQNNQPDSQARKLTQAAEILRATTKKEVVKIVKQFEGYSSSDQKTCLELVRKVPIFPGLVAYTYTHLIACPRRGWFSSDDWFDRVSELKQLVERWAKDDDIESVLSYDTIKKRLLEILRATKVKPEEHRCNSAFLNGTMMLNYDILNLAALAVLCITGSRKKDLLGKRGVEAEKLFELFHDLLEANVELEEGYRRYFFDAVIMFAKESGCRPRGIHFAEGTVSGLISMSQGGFGHVYKGMVGSRLVAVKALKRNDHVKSYEYNKQLSKEVIVWRHLRHPNCLPLYGIYIMPTDGPNISAALVSPWMDQGTLFKYLEDNPKANRTKLILDVVRGLNYLHSLQPHVAHRDIKPDNILITSRGNACLADFGLASAFDADDHFHTATSQVTMGGTRNYMAPEIFKAEGREAKRNVNKRASDMYALGCTIYAAYTSKHPFQGIPPTVLPVNVMSGRRPEFPEGKISLDMWSFVKNLWGQDPLKRLTAEMALGWMEVKAKQEGVDTRIVSLEEEWEWRGPHDDKCLWSVSL